MRRCCKEKSRAHTKQESFILLQLQIRLPRDVSRRKSSSAEVVGASCTSHCFPEDPEVSEPPACDRLKFTWLLLPLFPLSHVRFDPCRLRNFQDFCNLQHHTFYDEYNIRKKMILYYLSKSIHQQTTKASTVL